MLAATVRVTRDLDTAEEAVQDAYVQALRTWARGGVPDRPGAWLTTVARRTALNAMQRRRTLETQLPLLLEREETEMPEPDTDAIPDDQLRLIFICCHPALAPEAQVALTLRLVCGVATPDIAQAFLVAEATMAARLTRAKKKIAAARIPYAVPSADDLPERVDTVLTVIHLLYATGHTAHSGEDLVRDELTGRALDLARMLRLLLPDDREAAGLLALLLVHHARRTTRTDQQGRLHAAVGNRGAAPQAPSCAETDWSQILTLYDELLRIWPSPVVALNRAVAVSMVDGPEAALADVEAPERDRRLAGYRYLPATKADLLHRLGRDAEADAYQAALALSDNAAEQEFLAARVVSTHPRHVDAADVLNLQDGQPSERLVRCKALFAVDANEPADRTALSSSPMADAANEAGDQTDLVEGAVAWLTERLPTSWTVGRTQRTFAGQAGPQAQTLDAAIDLRANNGTTATLAVEARPSFEPRDVDMLVSGLARSLRSLAGYIPILVVAPWMSARTQRRLAAEGINFIDLTGNALVTLENPTLYLRSSGAQRNPAPLVRGQVRVRGPKAARLVRLLADVRPPYGIRELANGAGLAPGYVSQLIDALDREALVDRERRGGVRKVDLDGLLRRWAESYDVLGTNAVSSFLAPAGPARALDALEDVAEGHDVVVTGSFAAVRRAAVAAPALLCVYCRDPSQLAAALEVLPADAGTGANVALLRPFDEVVWDRTERERGISYAAVSQVAVDCLTGTGRMPAEGEALLKWMADNEDDWRAPGLAVANGAR